MLDRPTSAVRNGPAGARWGSATTRRVRLITGCILFVYVASHLLNHTLGLVSIATMEAMLVGQKFVWQGLAGSALLYGALITHAGLGLWALYERRHFRWTRLEAAQLSLGLAIPVLLANHVCVTRLAWSVQGLEKGYSQELYALWVASGFWGSVQVAVLITAWAHGCIGLHSSMRLRAWFPRFASGLLVAAVLLPVLALLGFEQAGRTLAPLTNDPAWRAEVLAVPHTGTADQKAAEAAWRRLFIAGYGLAIGGVLLARAARSWAEHRRGVIRVAFPGGAIVRMPRGLSVLDASRIGRLPHASVCGGRGRCSTCRVRVLGPPEAVPPPSLGELAVLDRIGADAACVRLACQLRPLADIAVLPLVAPAVAQGRVARYRHKPPAEERFVVALFADMRGSTELSRRHLPFDNLFLLGSFIAALANAIVRAGGVPHHFMGDGILALFGLDADAGMGQAAISRQGLLACRLIAQAVADFNTAFAGELRHPIGFGIGMHAGSAIVGEIGFGAHVTSTALGDPVNLASRLQAMTRERDCVALVSDAVFRLAGEHGGQPVEIEARGYGRVLAHALRSEDLRQAPQTSAAILTPERVI